RGRLGRRRLGRLGRAAAGRVGRRPAGVGGQGQRPPQPPGEGQLLLQAPLHLGGRCGARGGRRRLPPPAGAPSPPPAPPPARPPRRGESQPTPPAASGPSAVRVVRCALQGARPVPAPGPGATGGHSLLFSFGPARRSTPRLLAGCASGPSGPPKSSGGRTAPS